MLLLRNPNTHHLLSHGDEHDRASLSIEFRGGIVQQASPFFEAGAGAFRTRISHDLVFHEMVQFALIGVGDPRRREAARERARR